MYIRRTLVFCRQITQEFDTEKAIKKEDEESVNGGPDKPETEDLTLSRSLETLPSGHM